MHIVESQRGKPILVLEHFKYSKVTRPLASGEIKWRCINLKCTAFLKMIGINNDITEKNDDHLHELILGQVLQRLSVTIVAKRKATEDISNRLNTIFCSAVNNVPDSQDLQVSDIRNIQQNGLSVDYKTKDSELSKWLIHCYGLVFLEPENVSEFFTLTLMELKPDDN
ncbi:hypothetical protein QTP88_017126 [Uroleucon formosanum]